MIRAIMHGCGGKMGRTITELAAQDDALTIVAGIDPTLPQDCPYPVFATAQECNTEADVVIDFSIAPAMDSLFNWCEARRLPLVLCTTGLSEEQLAGAKKLSETTAVLRSANMSMGINTLLKLLQTAAGILADAGFDIEIVERHHNQKLDAPSGTALALADTIQESLSNSCSYVYDRSQVRQKRGKHEIGISAVRGGTIVGEHEIIFAGTDEVIEFKHTAYSKAIFAKGAIQAAKFLAGKPAGMYDMSDVIAAANT